MYKYYVEIDITDSSPFFIRPFHAREEDKAILDKERKRLCYLGISKEGFSAYSSPVMLISRKMTQDKRVVIDFRHLNMKISKNNLAYPLLKDTFMLLGSSKCEVMSVLDLKDAFNSLRLTENSQEILWNTPILWQHILLVSMSAHGTQYFPHGMAVIHKCNIKLSV